MLPDRDNIEDVAIAALLVGAAMLVWSLLRPMIAHAQVSGAAAVVTVPSSVTSDAATEQNTSGILQEDTLTANSVTTGGGGGDYQPNSAYIANLDQQLFSGINAQNFATWFPGWQALPPNSTDTVAIPMTNTVLTTYGQAIALAQSQERELEGENFSNIETTSSKTTDLLTAIQANTEAVLADIQQQQYVRQLLATLVTVEATKAGQELSERAQEEATNATSLNLGRAP
jgi:hypothetical protein